MQKAEWGIGNDMKNFENVAKIFIRGFCVFWGVFFLLQTVNVLPRVVAETVDSNRLEEQLMILVNRHREKMHLEPLKTDLKIVDEARRHSRDMASGDCGFNHDGFDDRVDRIGKKVPFSSAAENIAWTDDVPNLAEKIVGSWIKSPPHRANMEAEHDLSGIGVVRASSGRWYATQIFILQRRDK